MADKKMSNLKPIVSISEICQMLQLSRSRYYQLVNSGFFQKPSSMNVLSVPIIMRICSRNVWSLVQLVSELMGRFYYFILPANRTDFLKEERRKSILRSRNLQIPWSPWTGDKPSGSSREPL